MFTLQIGNEKRTFEQIRVGEKPIQHKAWQFCHDWLNGQTDFVLHTSGSTGKPKPIEITRKQMEASAKSTIQALGLIENDNFLVCINTDFIGGKMMLVRGLELGANLVVIEPSGNPLQFIEPNSQFDFMAVVPLQLENILSQSPEKKAVLNQMKAIIVGGAPVGKKLEQKIQLLKSPVFSTYGMTETISHIALKRLNGNEKSDCFQSLPNVEISQDERGCLAIQSEITKNEVIITNDLVELISPTEFRWLGRVDNIINSGGIKIQLEELESEIEQILLGLEINCQFAICPIPDEKLGQKIVLFLELKSLSDEIFSELTSTMGNQLGKYRNPKETRFQTTFPLTASGKIDRKKLVVK
ncbi:MAG: O-succinylbenzoic acid--CoA ligase [Arenicella sp.]|jgi:O-succinylbenzoic acid--CoA ligase